MQDIISVTGIILKQAPIGEYDRRICLLTKEKGKISAFAKGARRPGNRLAAATNPFSFGLFKLYPGKTAYTVEEAEIQNYFEGFREDFAATYYGMYFAEICDFYCRENNDERKMMKLLYQSFRALLSPSLPNPLVQCIFELKAIEVNGEYPGVPKDREYSEACVYALNYIEQSSIERLYTFTVADSVLTELQEVAERYRNIFMKHDFKSLEILKTLS